MTATRRVISATCAGLMLLLVFTTGSAQAQPDCCFNPFFLPFAVAGAAVSTAAAIVSAPFGGPWGCCDGPGYYAPPPPRHGYRYGPRPYYHGREWRSDYYGRYQHGGSRYQRKWGEH